MIPRIYRDEACPLEGYEGVSVRVLQNASDADMKLWHAGNLGQPSCADCAAARTEAQEAAAAQAQGDVYCLSCAAARATFGEALARFYEGGQGTELDFTSPEAALASLDSRELPTELAYWLLMLPAAVRERRYAELEKNYRSSSTTPS